MKKYLCLYTFWMFFFTSIGQNQSLTIKQIDSIVLKIELTCISGGISEYTIKTTNKTTKRKSHGFGADWYYTDSSRTKLVKVVKEVLLESESFDVFYFHQDSLIYVKSSNYTYVGDKKIKNWYRQCYFFDGGLHLIQDNIKISFNPKNYIEIARSFFEGNQIWRRK